MDDWQRIIRALADHDDACLIEGNVAIFTRQGTQYELTLRKSQGVGLAVETADRGLVEFHAYVQGQILDLPTLARQMLTVLDATAGRRPAPFIDGPASFGDGATESAATGLKNHIGEGEVGSTKLIQLMAGAGQGKTVLLEEVARELARAYVPEKNPSPLMVPVDLLGRYVGSIDDAVAGTLNNTFIFPRLSHKDVILAVREGWMVLALDAFDELVARIGARDAFSRVTDLLEQLEGRGIVLLSARETFFHLHEITSVIRSVLNPRRGSFVTVTTELLPWRQSEAETVFLRLGSANPPGDVAGLLAAFPEDEQMILQPFFLTRLAKLWTKDNERFEGASDEAGGELARVHAVIETFLDREAGEKWTDQSRGRPILTPREHMLMLGSVAAEMWRSGAFRMEQEEVRIAAEMGLSQGGTNRETVDLAMERVNTHAAFATDQKRVAFLHDRLFNYYLGRYLSHLIDTGDVDALSGVLRAKEIFPETAEWCAWEWGDKDASSALKVLNALAAKRNLQMPSNLGRLTSVLAAGRDMNLTEVLQQSMVGDSMRGRRYQRVHFRDCRLWNTDLSGTAFVDCRFDGGEWSEVFVDKDTIAQKSVLDEVRISSVHMEEGGGFYDPPRIRQVLGQVGFTFLIPTEGTAVASPALRADEDIVRIVDKLVRQANRTCDISEADVQGRYGDDVLEVIAIAEQTGVLQEYARPTSGKKKRFVRFQVDRDALLRAQVEASHEERIERFWIELGERFPPPTNHA